MFIRTERLFLRPGWVEDAPELARAIAHEPVVRMLSSVPWPYCEEHALAWLDAPCISRLPRLLVTLPGETGRIVGGCGLEQGEGGAVEVGYWITPDCWGRGYAREALGALVSAARWLRHERLVGCPPLDNSASSSVLRGAGFRPTGRTARFHSLGRGEEVASAEYALELMPDCPQQGRTQRAAYVEEAAVEAAA